MGPPVRPSRRPAALKTASKTCVFNMDTGLDQDVTSASSARDSSLVRTYDALGSRSPPSSTTKLQARRMTLDKQPQLQIFSMDEDYASNSARTPTAARDSSLSRSYDALTSRQVDKWTWAEPHVSAHSRPASPKNTLPPVAPPCKKQMFPALPSVARGSSKFSAMSLDLGDFHKRMEHTNGARDSF